MPMFSRLIRSDIASIDAYKPGKPIEEVQRELGIRDVIKLASNENALGSSPRALKAVRETLSKVHRYPEGTCFYLKRDLAKTLGVPESNLLFGNGSDELLDIILKTVRDPKAEILTADVTFAEYKIYGAVNGFIVKTVPLRDFKYDLPALAAAVTPRTKAIFIANPNNPTGTLVNKAEVTAFLRDVPENVLIVFDEAYFEYVDRKDFPDLLPLVGRRPIVLLRTFSKIYGLAGLRVGYMIADSAFTREAERVRPPFNVNALAQAAARAALKDKGFVRRSRALMRREKRFLYEGLASLGIWFKESEANFVFVRFNAGAAKVFALLLKRGVIIREMSSYNLNNYARITVGTRPENARLLRALKEIRGDLS